VWERGNYHDVRGSGEGNYSERRGSKVAASRRDGNERMATEEGFCRLFKKLDCEIRRACQRGKRLAVGDWGK